MHCTRSICRRYSVAALFLYTLQLAIRLLEPDMKCSQIAHNGFPMIGHNEEPVRQASCQRSACPCMEGNCICCAVCKLALLCLGESSGCRESQEWISGQNPQQEPGFLGGRSAVVWAREYSTEDARCCDCNALQEALGKISGAKRMVGCSLRHCSS